MDRTPIICIVDDDESVRTAMRAMVESFGYMVDTFGSADEFLRSIACPIRRVVWKSKGPV